METKAVKLSNGYGIELNLILNLDEIKEYEEKGFFIVEELNKGVLTLKY